MTALAVGATNERGKRAKRYDLKFLFEHKLAKISNYRAACIGTTVPAFATGGDVTKRAH